MIINDAGTTGLRNLETVDIRNSTIAENKTGIVNAGVLHAWDSTISGNTQRGIENYGTMELTGVTIFDNETSGTGLFSNGAGILTLNGGP